MRVRRERPRAAAVARLNSGAPNRPDWEIRYARRSLGNEGAARAFPTSALARGKRLPNPRQQAVWHEIRWREGTKRNIS